MAWITPEDFETDEVLAATKLNNQVNGNLLALKSPPTGVVNVEDSSTQATTSTTFVDVTGASITITTGGGRVLLSLMALCHRAAEGSVYLTFSVDGTDLGPANGVYTLNALTLARGFFFQFWTDELAAGSHTFKARVRVAASTATLTFGPMQFAAREVS